MPQSPLPADLIALESTALHDRPLSPARVDELAAEVGRINAAVFAQAQQRHAFHDDPFQFLAVLESLKHPEGGRE